MKKIFCPLFLAIFLLAGVSGNAAKIPVSTPDSCFVEKPAISNIKDALKDFSNLSHSGRKLRMKEMRKALKAFKADKRAGKDVDSDLILQVVMGLFLPPLGVYLHEGETNNKFWISVLLTVLGLLFFGFAGILLIGTLPSIIYALIVILGH